LTEAQLRQLLGFQTRDALDGFLKSHEVWLNYTKEDLERERALCGAWASKLNAVVVADATPLHYLILVDAVHVCLGFSGESMFLPKFATN